MSQICLTLESKQDFTIISNIFIDEYMPLANGDFVKAYLLLQRYLGSGKNNISISDLADCLENTEKDILRALNYWEKVNLLAMKRNERGEITEITLQLPETTRKKEQLPEPETEKEISSLDTILQKRTIPDREDYRIDKLGDLSEDKNFTYLRDLISVLLNRMLLAPDIELLMYLQRGLQFTDDLIMYLYEYCISKNIDRNTYIESVALNWYKDHIQTTEEAKKYSQKYDNSGTYKIVKKAFGLSRQFGEAEEKYLKTWISTFHMPDDLIQEACNRAIMRTGKPDFPYANSILARWYKEEVFTLEEARKNDQAYHKKTVSGQKHGTTSVPYEKKTSPPGSGSKIPYNQYPQRSYSQEELDSIECRLLRRGTDKNNS